MNLLASITIIAPIFFIMLAGFWMGKTSIFPEGSGAAKSLSTFVWYIAIPALIFSLLASSPFPTLSDFMSVASYYLVLYLIYIVSAYLIAPALGILPKGRGVFAFSCCFGNLGFVGIPVVEGMLGQEGLTILLMIISFHMLTLFPVTVIVTEFNKEQPGNRLQIVRKAFVSSLKNPVVLSLFFGLAISAMALEIPVLIQRILDFPANAAAPVGLFAVGMSLSRVKLRGALMEAIVPTTMKMAIFPIAVYLSMTYVFEASELWVKTTTLIACMPTGMAAYSMAERYQVNLTRAASTVLLGAIVSAFSLVFVASLLA